MAEKTYYWIKLQMDFFKTPVVKLLRKMSGGATYTVIYLKMILLSLDDGGYIYFTGIGKSFSEEIALTLDEEPVDVEFLLTFLRSKRLVEFSAEQDDMAFKFADDVVAGLIGKETGSAKRVRAYRKRAKQLALQSNNDVTMCNTEKELELELDLDSELELDKDKREVRSPAKAEPFDWKSVINYLNDKAGKHFRHTASNKKIIMARHKDGNFAVDDMKQVIDNQCSAWLNKTINNQDMTQYLRPETLFRASKFEGYLNNNPQNGEPKSREDWFGETS
ncbi:replisome organizer [Lactobacillus sp. CBA3605]|uniref:phage replisome organizer N-terminal domain-containing protein n=1 Tax=Lactobacillus sp. CBA3605 TaxID=2099788 RepID=UPI000CFD1A78|nr:phage replisome organizer N-terminal domain-containing protein [Lactobacillus sp. CBA3605]AVK60551.1 replisome organizer [Lactobacillus sp. CBA3605]